MHYDDDDAHLMINESRLVTVYDEVYNVVHEQCIGIFLVMLGWCDSWAICLSRSSQEE